MEYSDVTLDSLPDEILLIIFKQLSNVEVLYSLSDVNQRLNQIVYGPDFTSQLILSNCCLYRSFASPPISVLSRFCFQILPRIHDKIQRLGLEASFIDHILFSSNFPNLSSLSLFDLEIEHAKYVFTGKAFHSVVKETSTCFLTLFYVKI